MNLPQAGTATEFVYRRRLRERPRERGLRVAAAVGSLLVHLFFLFAFVLGPAYQVVPLPAPKGRFLQVRLIEAPKPQPPPPPRGTPPKELGPRHQGHAGQVASINASTASMPTSPMAQPVTPAAEALPAVTLAAQPVTPNPKPVAAPKPPASVPRPAPMKQLQPIPLAGEPPAVTVTAPSPQPPIPPKFQPEPVRKPQLEGTRPLPPTPSLTMPELPTQTPPKIGRAHV